MPLHAVLVGLWPVPGVVPEPHERHLDFTRLNRQATPALLLTSTRQHARATPALAHKGLQCTVLCCCLISACLQSTPAAQGAASKRQQIPAASQLQPWGPMPPGSHHLIARSREP